MNKNVPLRMCLACRSQKPKKEMIRVVKTADGYVLDETGKLNGRGAYVCNNPDCINKCVKSKSFNRSFKGKVPDDLYSKLKGE